MLVATLETVATGELCFQKGLTDQFLLSRRKALTNRESQMIGLLAQAKKNKDITWELQITEGTVKVYLSRLYDKLGVSDRDRYCACEYGRPGAL